MGQKANPNGMRFGVIRDWKGKWFPKDKTQWAEFAILDKKIRNFLEKNVKIWALGSIEILRTQNVDEINIVIHTAKPGVVLGQDGANVKKLTIDLCKLLKTRKLVFKIDVLEIENPALDATVVANEIAMSLENRGSFRIAQKKAIAKTMKAGAKGIKTSVAGRLNGVDMARTEGYSEGIIPLQTLRNDIDFAIAKAHTTYGVLGIKVWISRGEVLKASELEMAKLKERTTEDAREKKPRSPYKRDFSKNEESKTPNTKVNEGGKQ